MLGVTTNDIVLSAIAGVVVIVIVLALYKELLITSFDRAAAQAMGLPVFWLDLLLLMMISLTIVVAADHRIGEVDLDLGAEAVRMGAQLAEAVADRNLHWLQHLDETAGGGLGDDAGLIDRSDESRRAAVHDRNFRAIDFDGGVVDAHAPQRSKHVLGGGDQRTFTVAEDGCKLGCNHGTRDRGNFAITIIETGAITAKPE